MTDPPVVLLAAGERLDDEIEWGGAKVAEVVPLVASANPFLRENGNASYQISFRVQRNRTTDAVSRASILDDLIEWGTMTAAVLKVEAAGVPTEYWEFSKCSVTARNTRGRTVGLGLRTVAVNILAVGLSRVTSPLWSIEEGGITYLLAMSEGETDYLLTS